MFVFFSLFWSGHSTGSEILENEAEEEIKGPRWHNWRTWGQPDWMDMYTDINCTFCKKVWRVPSLPLFDTRIVPTDTRFETQYPLKKLLKIYHEFSLWMSRNPGLSFRGIIHECWLLCLSSCRTRSVGQPFNDLSFTTECFLALQKKITKANLLLSCK